MPVLDALILGLPFILMVLWLWPQEDPKDPYDDPKNWGDQ